MLSYDINKSATAYGNLVESWFNKISKRATALECLNHAWITANYPDDYEYVSLKSVFLKTSFSRSAASTQAVFYHKV